MFIQKNGSKKDYKPLFILSYFVVYLILFACLEKLHSKPMHLIHLKIDDYIPFCEFFIIPYMLWFGYVAWGVLQMAFHNKADFYKLCAFLYTGMTVFLICSALYPNGHNLRPCVFLRDNLFTDLCAWLYETDTPTNLFPSIHVYNSIGIHLSIVHNQELRQNKVVCTLSFILMTLIILSTMFLKQHSVFDVGTALLLAFFMNQLVYHKYKYFILLRAKAKRRVYFKR